MERIWDTYEDMKEIIYAADMDTYELLYLNRRARELYGVISMEQIRGKKCYEFLQGNAEPCKMCTNRQIRGGRIYEWEFYNQHLKRFFTLKDQMINVGGRPIRIEIAKENTEEDESHRMFGGINQMALLINECMRMALQEADSDHGIEQLIEYLGGTLSGDRVYVFELSSANEWNNTYEWCAKNVTAEIQNLQNIPYDAIDVWQREFKHNRFVVIRDLEATKYTDPVAYEYLQPQNIHSIIVAPLYRDGALCGFYGVDNPPVEKINEVAELIKTISHVIETMISKRDLARKLEDLSYHDQMLQMGNRHAVRRFLDQLDPAESLGIVFCDVCGLKRVNDTLGHAAGDQLLLHSCECLKTVFPDEGLFRIGGDEMLVLVRGSSEEEFQGCCDRLQQVMLEKDVPLAVGTLWRAAAEGDLNALIAQADAKMYEDKVRFYKNAGLSRWRSNEEWFGTTTRYEEIVECVHSGLEKALEEGQFVVYYQPQYNQRDRSLYGAEALVRWIHPEKGLIPPNKFIPYLEKNGMISKLDEYVLRETCRNQRKWIDAGLKTVPISVNLSRRDLETDEICRRVSRVIESFGLSTREINLEVTETAYMEQPEAVIDVVKKFQELGFKVEMDDFGSGYSSLNSLKDIPVDILKLDMKFVDGDVISERSGKILSAVIRMAHWLGMPVIAEGVETREQAEFLSSIGCFYVQGYYFNRPMPTEMFEERLIGAKPNLERDGRVTEKNSRQVNYFSTESLAEIWLDGSLGAAAIIEYDGENLELVRSNEAMYDMFGLTRKGQLENYSHASIFYHGETDTYVKAIHKAIETMDCSECETRCVSIYAPEEPFWVRTRFKYLRGYDGIYTFLINVENVDSYRKASQMNVHLYALLDQMEKNGSFGSMVLQLGEPMCVTYFNSTAAGILGYTQETFRELLDRDAFAAVVEEDRETLQRAVVRAVKKSSELMNIRIRYLCGDGQIRTFTVLGIAREKSDGTNVLRLILLAKSFQEGVLAQQLPDAVQAEDMRRVTEEIAGPYVRCSARELRILDASRSFREMLGYGQSDSESESIQYDFLENYLWPADCVQIRRFLADMEQGLDRTQAVECHVRTRQGVYKWVLASGHAFQMSDGRRDFYITFRDVDGGGHDAALRARLYRTMEHSAQTGIVCFRIHGKRWSINHVGEGYLEMLSYSKGQLLELLGNDVLALVHPEEREQIRRIGVEFSKTRSEYVLKYRMLNGKGEYVWLMSYETFSEYNNELYLNHLTFCIPELRRMSDDLKFEVFPVGGRAQAAHEEE